MSAPAGPRRAHRRDRGDAQRARARAARRSTRSTSTSTAPAATSTGRSPSTARRADPARGAAPPIRREPFMNRSSFRCPRCQRTPSGRSYAPWAATDTPWRGGCPTDSGSRLIRSWKRLRHCIFVRHRHNWSLLFRFGLVGGSGVLVNLLVLILLKRSGPHFDDVSVDLPLTDFNIRWYHLYPMVAFLVANLWNFQLNRHFTFRSAEHSGWFREYGPFLAVGLAAQFVGLGHPHPADAPRLVPAAAVGRLRQLDRPADQALLGQPHRHRGHGADLLRAEQALDLLRGPRRRPSRPWRKKPRPRRPRSPATEPDPPDIGPRHGLAWPCCSLGWLQ